MQNKTVNQSQNMLICKLMCLLSLAMTILPAVDYYCPWYVALIPVMVIVFPMLLKRGDALTGLLFSVGLIIGFVLLEYYFAKRSWSFASYFFNGITTFTPCFIALAIRDKTDDKKFFSQILQVVALFMAITSITTIQGLKIYPKAARELAAVDLFADQVAIYQKANIGNYQFIYSLVLFIPVILWLIKHSGGILRIINIAELIVYILCIFESQYTIALIMVAISLPLFFATTSKKRMIAVGVILIIFFLFNGLSILGDAFAFFSEQIKHEYVADRFLQVSQLLKGQTVDTETSTQRLMHYESVLSTFSQHPLFGANLFMFDESVISGHSTILDICAGGGLVAISMVIWIVRQLYVLILGRGRKPFVIYTIWILAVGIAILNPLTFILPIMLLFTCTVCIQKISTTQSIESQGI